ncbi:MAG: transcriptional regulator, luxR family, partial [Thermoleophilia bacterium]|nr:transcriptional regulator, luxR family [Thermoleophilia bacterium]
MPSDVVGRDAELAVLRDFLASVSDGASALVLQGEAGVGKTTLWRAGVAEAEQHGLRVLQALPAESETALSFSGIGDLLDPVLDEALAPLPTGQRRALSRALVLEEDEGPPPDPHAVGVAVLNALRSVAEECPVLLAVDDVQWLDTASSGALAYAVRRLRTERVGVLLSRRAPLESALLEELRRSLPAERFRDLEVGPLDLGALHHVVQDHLGIALPRPLLAEVHQAAGGNPFYALEIVRTLQRTGVSVEAGQPLPVPESLHELVHGRLLALPAGSRDFLVAAAAHAYPTVAVTEAASGVGRDVGLTPALEARIVKLERDRIHFTHPLLAAGAYETADQRRRSEIHARLAELIDDPEARGRHLAASVTEPDEAVAAALDEAADRAWARGAPGAAALLLERARELTPPDGGDDAYRRAVDAAYLHFESGDSRKAEEQLQDLIRQLAPGVARARALMRLARVWAYQAHEQAAELFLQAVEEAEGDREVLVIAHEGVAVCLLRLREQLADALEHAERGVALALELGDDALAAEALGNQLLLETYLGRKTAGATLTRVLALQDAANDRRVLAQPLTTAAAHWWWTDELERARDALLEMLQCSRDLGDESAPPLLLVLLGQVECLLGELETARLHALAGQEASEQSGQRALLAYNLALESLVEAQLGRVKLARAAALRALELVPDTGSRSGELVATGALGHLDLVLGDSEAAAARLGPIVVLARREAIVEPGAIPFVIDHIEALIELGRRDEAVELLDWYEGNARRLERASALANCRRCRGLLAASEGRLDDAIAACAKAIEWHARVELPLDRGRTLLALGAAQRRAKRRREARETLEEALGIFERIGAALWAERAHAELRRISGRAPMPGALTPAEERVAALVAEGKTNREVAATLFLSERTVEGHLSHV